MEKQKIFFLIMGNIGTGKTHFINNKIKDRDGREKIFCDDYDNPDYFERKINESLRDDKVIILEGPYMSKGIRRGVISGIKRFFPEIIFICIDFGPGNETSLNRRIKDPHFSMTENEIKVVHSNYHSEYEKPKLDEGFKKIIKKY